jgi:DNA-binding response OmpR family regulator
MQRARRRFSDVVVVDPCPDQYQAFVVESPNWDICLRTCLCADQALRCRGVQSEALWLINTRLPDMPGVDLLTLLRARDPGVTVFLVGDTYRLQDEQAARAAGATAYVCKPLHVSWLQAWRRGMKEREFAPPRRDPADLAEPSLSVSSTC